MKHDGRSPAARAADAVRKKADDAAGSRERLSDMLMPVCGRDTVSEVGRYRKRIIICYLAIIAVMAAAALLSLIYTLVGGMGIDEIKRPEPGGKSVYIPVEVSAEYGGQKAREQLGITVEERNMTDEEIEQEMDRCEEYLSSLFERDESGALTVSSSVKLPNEYGGSGMTVRWESSDPVLISEKGNVDVISLSGASETVTLTAELSCGGHVRDVDYDIILRDDSSMYRGSMLARISSFASGLNDDRDSASVTLPSELSDGIMLSWRQKRRSAAGAALVIGAAVFAFVYSGRYRRVDKRVKTYRQNVKNEFPAVIDKLILLLNSGLTVFGAMMRISDDYERSEYCSCSEMRAEAAEIGRRVRNMNSNMIDEWKDLAARMESSDMLRFCTILADNMNTGSGLVEKLEAESRTLREMRRKEMRKKIHMTDSKMMLPMMIMLFSLILITVSPAIISF